MSEPLKWDVEEFNHRAQGNRRVYWIKSEPLGTNRFRPAIQRGAVTFYCDCPFDSLEDAKVFCQSDHDSIQEICEERASTLRTRIRELEAKSAVIREALGYCRDYVQHQPYGTLFKLAYVEHALSTDAGKPLLSRLQEAARLLRDVPWIHQTIPLHNYLDWIKARDAFLNPTNKDVM